MSFQRDTIHEDGIGKSDRCVGPHVPHVRPYVGPMSYGLFFNIIPSNIPVNFYIYVCENFKLL